jgi:hypothetical protein
MIRSVHVEGYQEGDLIVARVVRDISVAAGQRDSDRFRRDADPADKPHSWLTYQQQRRP